MVPVKCVKGGIRSRRRADTTHSEGILSFDENGNRKPAHKHVKASRKCEPYQLNRVNSLHGLHSASPTDSLSCNSPISSSDSTPEVRKSKSEAASPLMTGSSSFAQLNGQLTPLDLSGIDYSWTSTKYDLYGTSEFEQPMFSAGLSAASVDWSHYDGLDFAAKAAADFAPSNYSHPQSYGGFEITGSEQPPTLTTSTSTSGEPSEIDELIPSSFDDLESSNGFRAGTMGTGYEGVQMTQNLLGSTTDLESLNYEEFKMMKADTQFLPTPASLAGDEPTFVTTASAAISSFSQATVDEDTTLWMSGDYCHGLPSQEYQLPLTDSPDGTMATFWGNQ